MHYKDGTPAQIGDIVRGKGYNLPHEILGPVVGLTPGVDSCNIRVATVTAKPVDDRLTAYSFAMLFRHAAEDPLQRIEPYVEAGACRDFTLVHRPDAEAAL